EQQGTARRLLRRIVGRPPEKPPGKASSATFLLASAVGVFLAALSWWGGPSLSDLATACVMLGALLFSPANPAAYRRWWGELTWDLVRLGGMALFYVGLGLLIAEMALGGSWGWVWWSVIALALCVVVAVAGHYYGPEDEPRTEDGPPEGRDPSN
ncbi:MAG TPA: hypothetical protein VGV91_02795, partial [Rubrobacter sp.]|nr:hypothetical protein [Rubrobacter sp.]